MGAIKQKLIKETPEEVLEYQHVGRYSEKFKERAIRQKDMINLSLCRDSVEKRVEDKQKFLKDLEPESYCITVGCTNKMVWTDTKECIDCGSSRKRDNRPEFVSMYNKDKELENFKLVNGKYIKV